MTATYDVTTGAPSAPPLRLDRAVSAVLLSVAAVVAATVAAALSLLRPGLLRGAAVTDGNLRGTALVVLVAGVPLVLGAVPAARRGSGRALVVWLAGLFYLGYQGVLFCFATPMNRLFPFYVAMLGLAGWGAAALLRAVDTERLAARLGPLPRVVPAALGTAAVVNALAWLARALPIVWTGDPPASVTESGLDTSAVLVQDLALWLPLALVASVLAWRRTSWGTVLAAAMLLFYAVEAVGVASDQWWGVRADDGHPAVAAMSAVPAGLAVGAALGTVWLVAVGERRAE